MLSREESYRIRELSSHVLAISARLQALGQEIRSAQLELDDILTASKPSKPWWKKLIT